MDMDSFDHRVIESISIDSVLIREATSLLGRASECDPRSLSDLITHRILERIAARALTLDELECLRDSCVTTRDHA